MIMIRNKINRNGMESRYVIFDPHFDTPDEISAKSLSDYTVSSTVTHGPNASFLKFLLESLNDACLNNLPELVERITVIILRNRLTEFMDISKMEIILANVRAVTLLHPEFPIKDYYEELKNRCYSTIDLPINN